MSEYPVRVFQVRDEYSVCKIKDQKKKSLLRDNCPKTAHVSYELLSVPRPELQMRQGLD